MPGALLPENPDQTPYYTAEELSVLRLSSKNHVDIPVQLPNQEVVHVLIAHPTPPVFDGPEDRNGRRNHDEIRFFSDYVLNKVYFVDDKGTPGGLAPDQSFVILGDYNADPYDGDSSNDPVRLFFENPRITDAVTNGDFAPASQGGKVAAEVQGKANLNHQGNPALDTGDFFDGNPGNLRIDYVLPSNDLKVKESGIFWPVVSDPASEVVAISDHRMVWVDVIVH